MNTNVVFSEINDNMNDNAPVMVVFFFVLTYLGIEAQHLF